MKEGALATRWVEGTWVHLLALGLLYAGWMLHDLDRPQTGDAVRYEEISRTMVVSGDWLVPINLDEPYFKKPPLCFWLTAASMSAFGTTQQVACLPALLAGAGLVVALYFAVTALAGSLAGSFAGLALVLAPHFYAETAQCRIDPLFLVLVLAALAAVERARTRPAWFAVAWALLGAALLTKGPAIVLPLGVLAVSAALRRDAFPFRSTRFYAASWAFFAVAVPWYALMSIRFGGAFWAEHAGRQVAARLATSDVSPFEILRGSVFFPGLVMTLAVVGAVLALRRAESRPAVRRAALIAVVWIALVLLSQLVNSIPLPRYVYLAFPALAGLAGFALAAGARRWIGSVRGAGLAVAFASVGGAALLVAGMAGHERPRSGTRDLEGLVAIFAGRAGEGPVLVRAVDEEHATNFVRFALRRREVLLGDDMVAEVGRRGGDVVVLADEGGLSSAAGLYADVLARGSGLFAVHLRSRR